MSNIALLTADHAAIAAKRRAKRVQTTAVVFDDNARREFLTGFHKRKQAKADAAKKRAQEREKQERLEARREQRRILRERALENAAQVENAYGGSIDIYDDDDDDDDDGWTGIASDSDDSDKPKEYEDEETLATVTVVEDFDPDTLIHGSPEPPSEPLLPPSEHSTSIVHAASDTPDLKPRPKKKPRSKDIKYETNAARKRERQKQSARRTEKAELAGGKAARKKKGSRR